MAFPTGWTYRYSAKVNYLKVPGDVTYFPVLLTPANLPASMITSGGPQAAYGGDIVITSDPSGAVRIPCEVVEFALDANPALSRVQIFTTLPFVSGAVDTPFYVWWGKPGESQPAVTDAFGRNSVWSSSGYFFALHLEENNTMDGQVHVDSRGKYDMTRYQNSRASGALHMGYGQDMNPTASSTIRSGVTPSPAVSNTFLFSVWVKRDNLAGTMQWARVAARSTTDRFDVAVDTRSGASNGMIRFISLGAGATGGWRDTGHYITDTAWHHVAASHSGGTVKIYLDGVPLSYAYTVNHENARFALGGRDSSSTSFRGVIDEGRWLDASVKSDSWVLSEYNAGSDPGVFVLSDGISVLGNKSRMLLAF